MGKPGYPVFTEIMDNLVRFTFVYGLLILIAAIVLCFDKNINKTPKILILILSIISMLPNLAIM